MISRRSFLTALCGCALAGATFAVAPGCETVKKTVAIPPGADKVRTGKGEAFTYEADRKGTVYVYDDDTQTVVYKNAIVRNDKVQVDPKAGTVELNGKSVYEGLNKSHRYDVYLR